MKKLLTLALVALVSATTFAGRPSPKIEAINQATDDLSKLYEDINELMSVHDVTAYLEIGVESLDRVYGLAYDNDMIATLFGTVGLNDYLSLDVFSLYNLESGDNKFVDIGPTLTITDEKWYEFTLGYVYEINTQHDSQDYQYVNASAGMPGIPLSPKLKCEWELYAERGALYYQLEVGHEFEHVYEHDSFGAGLALNASFGYGNSIRNRYDSNSDGHGFKDMQLTLSIPCDFGEGIRLTPFVRYIEQMSREMREAARAVNHNGNSWQVTVGAFIGIGF